MSDSESAKRGVQMSPESSGFDCSELHLSRLSVESGISRPFAYDVEVFQKDALDVASVLGEDVAVAIVPNSGGTDWRQETRLRGMVVAVEDLLGGHTDYRAYRLRIAPRLERLALSASHDIFLGATIPAVIEDKLARVNLMANAGAGSDVVFNLSASYTAREIVVQHDETDLAFVSRHAEHLGISFYFRDDGDLDQLIVTDNAAGFRDDKVRIPFTGAIEDQHILRLEAKHRMVPKAFSVHDYNYCTPQVALLSTADLATGFAGDVVEYGAHTKTPGEAGILAKIRAEEHGATELVYYGESNVPALRPGMHITVTDHPVLDEVSLLLVDVTHEGTQANAHTGGEPGTYKNRFHAIPGDRMYRPPRRTPRPRIAGVVNGVIDPNLGGSQEVAQLDKQGRYRVRFLFDTAARGSGAPSSHWLRMAQNHAGENYGTHFPLKPGTEVLIAFVDGDPDRPVILGAVPNPLTPSPVISDTAMVHRIRSINGTMVEFT